MRKHDEPIFPPRLPETPLECLIFLVTIPAGALIAVGIVRLIDWVLA